ncbi:MAG TPA: 1-acyl-sn-glycerol-3-phosphate acyltransferase [Isosphaeraceae bacterium]|jgi:1-acyl-sn-glycerol-3-phosphate acyltransferase|nr:1-acyl-sn-glycerol-3-phosphate acyltransferase [Isosphaeraceae bacterium]
MSYSSELPVGLVAVVAAPVLFVATLPWTIQSLFRLALSLRYRLVVVGLEHVPRRGPVLLVSNHVTWIDGFILAAVLPRQGRALVNADYIAMPGLSHLARWVGLIPVASKGPHAQRAAIRAGQEALDRGYVLGIFPEAQLSRNGLTGAFLRGLEMILRGREHVPVVPVFLDNLWGSIFSFSGGSTFQKRPNGWRRTVIISFGPPIPPPVTTFAVRQGVVEAGVRAFAHRPGPSAPLETIDPALPRLEVPGLGLLAASTADWDRGGIRQTGQKPGTLGQAVPGVALRVVDDDGAPLPADADGHLQALLAGRPDWLPTGLRARLDRDGFVRLADPS